MMDAKGTDGAVVRQFGGGVARIRPDGSELEVYVYNTRNQFDVAISPTLELFTRDNTNDGKGWNLRVHHQVRNQTWVTLVYIRTSRMNTFSH